MTESPTETQLSPQDPCSFSRPDLAIVTDLKLNLSCDFIQKYFVGTAELTVHKLVSNTNEVLLDVSNLKIDTIQASGTQKSLVYTISKPVDEYGSQLSVNLPKSDADVVVIIHYQTNPTAHGLKWLESSQTFGKEHEFVYSQFYPFYARTVVPCQDTPAVKTPYSAVITVPKEYEVIMSAPKVHKRRLGGASIFTFTQLLPVPMYTLALVVGAMQSRSIGPRSCVWAEEVLLEQAQYEFAETEQQLKCAEEICGPYVWNTYNIVIMPPSFPFAGFENPCNNFVSSTILAGDQSLIHEVAFLMAHSWAGNLVSCRSFEHLWLTRGLSCFIQRKIMARMTNPKEYDFAAERGYLELEQIVARRTEENQPSSLVHDLSGEAPIDAYTIFPREKGFLLFNYLQNLAGGAQIFEKFLHKFFDTYQYKSIDSNEFKEFYDQEFCDNERIFEIDWDVWLYESGLPRLKPRYDRSLINTCVDIKEQWFNWDEVEEPPFNKKDLRRFSTTQLIQLLEEFLNDERLVTQRKLLAIDKVFGFDEMDNCDIKSRWLTLCVRAQWKEKLEPAFEFLSNVGRIRLVRPLYRELAEWQEESPFPMKENLRRSMDNMMHIASLAVSSDLKL